MIAVICALSPVCRGLSSPLAPPSDAHVAPPQLPRACFGAYDVCPTAAPGWRPARIPSPCMTAMPLSQSGCPHGRLADPSPLTRPGHRHRPARGRLTDGNAPVLCVCRAVGTAACTCRLNFTKTTEQPPT